MTSSPLGVNDLESLPIVGEGKTKARPLSHERVLNSMDLGDGGMILVFTRKDREGYFRTLTFSSDAKAQLKLVNETIVEGKPFEAEVDGLDKGGTRAKPYKSEHYRYPMAGQALPSVQRRWVQMSGELNQVLDKHYRVNAQNAEYRREVNARRIPGLGWKVN